MSNTHRNYKVNNGRDGMNMDLTGSQKTRTNKDHGPFCSWSTLGKRQTKAIRKRQDRRDRKAFNLQVIED